MVETLHVLQVKDRTGQEVHDLAYGGRGLAILLHGTFLPTGTESRNATKKQFGLIRCPLRTFFA